MPRYVVWRPSPELPDGFLPPGMDGRWDFHDPLMGSRIVLGSATAVPTGRYEMREDGARAEVWEVRP